MTRWRLARVDWLCDVIRETVSVEELAEIDSLIHYSVDGLAATGEPVTQSGSELLSAKLRVSGGELLVSRLNPRRGHIALTASHDLPAVCSGEWVVLRPRSEVDLRFLYYVFQSERVRSSLEASVRSVTKSHGRVDAGDISKMWLQIPDVSSQRQVAEHLDRETQRIDESIDRLSRLLDLVHERELSAITSAIERVAKGQIRLSLVAALGTGHTPDRTKPEYWEDCTIPWVTAADLSGRKNPYEPLLDTAQHVSELGVANSAAVVHEPGTVMLCRTASVGLVCRIGVPMATTQAFVTWTPSPALDSEFLLYCLVAMRDEWDRLKFGSTHDTIYFPDIQSVRIPFADLAAQQSAVEEIREATAASQEIRRQSESLMMLLRERRQALISAAVKGELDVEAMA